VKSTYLSYVKPVVEHPEVEVGSGGDVQRVASLNQVTEEVVA
jgi:hypothetical protein